MPIPIRIAEQKNSLSLLIGHRKFTVHQGDILSCDADAIVCPVDQNLDLRSGVARIISSAAGRDIRNQRPLTPEPFGKVVVLPGGKLKVKYVFLSVLLGERNQEKMKVIIRQSVERAIRYAEFLRLKSVAFPFLGCPKTNPPFQMVAKEVLESVAQYMQRKNTKLDLVFLSAFNPDAYQAIRQEARYLSEI